MFVHGRWGEAYGLIVSHTSPTFTVSSKKFGVETPRYDRVDNYIVLRIDIKRGREFEEVAVMAAPPGPRRKGQIRTFNS